MVERLHAQAELGIAAQRDGESGGAGIPVAGVGHDDDVGAQGIRMIGEELGERQRACLLLTLEEERDAEVEVIAHDLLEGTEGADVGHDARLVVGGAATVQAAAAHGRLERRRLPEGLVADRLHVVVRVEQDRRAAVSCGTRREDGGHAPLTRAGDLGVGDRDGLEEAGGVDECLHRLGALPHGGGVEAGKGHRRDAHECAEIGEGRRDAGGRGIPHRLGPGELRGHAGNLKHCSQFRTSEVHRGQDT